MVTSKRTTKQYKTDAVTPGKHVQTTDMLCALVTEHACTRSTREHWERKLSVYKFCKHSDGFILHLYGHFYSITFTMLEIKG